MANSEWNDASVESTDRTLADGRILPDDFETEDAVFARFLQTHFDIEGEHLPPRYAQTILGNPLYTPVTEDFADRVSAAVFQRLNLTHPTPVVRHPVHTGSGRRTPRPHGKRPSKRLQVVGSALMLLVTLFAFQGLFTGSAFASMVKFLLIGHGGVQIVKSYPIISSSGANDTAKITPDQTIRFTPQWAGPTIQGYTNTSMDITYSRWWSKGALIMFRYQKSDATGVHNLTILEFEPRAQEALQAIQGDNVSPISNGIINGVFITGQWVNRNHKMMWIPDQRTELICQGNAQPSLVLWIAIDQMKGMDSEQQRSLLTTVASSLQSIDHLSQVTGKIQTIDTFVDDKNNQQFSNDVIALSADPASNTPTVYIQINPTTDDTTTNGQT